MFIALVGLSYSGKETIAKWLETSLGFTRVHIASTPSVSSVSATSSSLPALTFPDAASLLVTATTQWRSNFVTTDLCDLDEMEDYLKRPFFLLVGVEAGSMVRWKRYAAKEGVRLTDLESFQSFLSEQDSLLYDPQPKAPNPSPAPSPPTPSSSSTLRSPPSSSSSLPPPPSPSPRPTLLPSTTPSTLQHLLTHTKLTITNNFPSLPALHDHLLTLDLLKADRLRPSWDLYFMTLASLASLRSNCMKRRVGAILVRENRILSTGYNGTPRGMTNCNEGGCKRCNGGEKGGSGLNLCVCLHAEENALLEAGRDRIGSSAIIYCNTCPCLPCAVKIVQSGVKEVVYNLAYAMDEESARVLEEGGVRLRRLGTMEEIVAPR